MNRPDLNLLFTLDALLSEGSVARAAVRLGLSPSAMSRSLARLRTETGDPLLVRAGRGLVPTPRALQLRSQIGPLVDAAEAALRPVALLDVSQLDRTFTLRASEGFVENFGAALLDARGRRGPARAAALRGAPAQARARARATWRCATRASTSTSASSAPPPARRCARRRCSAIGLWGWWGRGIRCLAGRVTLARYAAARHVSVARRASAGFGPVDEALAAAGVERDITVVVGGFGAALALARGAELVATVPERHTGCLARGACDVRAAVCGGRGDGGDDVASPVGGGWGAGVVAGVCSGGLWGGG
jgi:DNA-binding transcriptional LysR family regulator